MKIITRHLIAFGLVPLAMLAPCAVVQAREGNVFSLTIAEAMSYDDNLFRQSPSQVTTKPDDIIFATTAGLDAEKMIGRQRFYGGVSLNRIHYQNYSSFDYTGDNSSLGWSTGFGSRSSGGVSFRRTSSQTSFSELNQPVRNIATTQTYGANLSLAMLSDWVAALTLSQDVSRNTAESRKPGDNTAYTGNAEFAYRPSTGSAAGVSFGYQTHDYASGYSYTQNDVLALLSWAPTGASSFDGRAGISRLSGSAISKPDTFGKASLSYLWNATAASRLRMRFDRNHGSESDSSNLIVQMRALSAQWTWAPSAKWVFDVSSSYKKRSFDSVQRHDAIRSAGVNATYGISTGLTLQLSLKDERRRSTPGNFDYDDQTYFIALQYSY